MSSTIKLYEHNQKAYDALLDMLGERDRACVIKPTGTGKFVIIAKMVQDNPDKRFLLLGTNDYMFNDLASQYPELAKEYLPELNSGITADELPIRNNTKVKWRCCKCGYEWITTIGHRAKRETGCPRCNGKKTSQSKMKAVVCVETGKIYESIMSAGRDVERTDGAICQALRNESRTCAGYHWKSAPSSTGL